MRARAIDSVSTLQKLLAEADVEDRRLVLAYLEAKQVLAVAFEAFAVERYADPTALASASVLVEEAMRSTYPGLPAKYVRVRGFGEAHSRLLAYLADRVGVDVSAAELRMLTGDARPAGHGNCGDLGFQARLAIPRGPTCMSCETRVPTPSLGHVRSWRRIFGRTGRSARSRASTSSKGSDWPDDEPSRDHGRRFVKASWTQYAFRRVPTRHTGD